MKPSLSTLSSEELHRYSRHLMLPEVRIEGQLKLRNSKVLLIGAGGLGAPIGLYLAAAGVGKLGIVDFDHVEASNLQRQITFSESDVGQYKAITTRERLKSLNSHIEVVAYNLRLDAEMALKLFEEYDLIVDGTDNFPTRYLINDACVLLGKTFVYGSIFRFEGQVTVFGMKGGPCYRCLYPEPPPAELSPNCAEGGVLGVLPGIIGTIQATEVIKNILGQEGTLSGRLLLLDALDMSFREIKIKKDPDCLICGENPKITNLVEHESFCDSIVSEMDPGELKSRLNRGDKILILDVREKDEHEKCNMGGQLIPLSELQQRMCEVNARQLIVVHCASGFRSKRAVQLMKKAGFDQVFSLKGGITAWLSLS